MKNYNVKYNPDLTTGYRKLVEKLLPDLTDGDNTQSTLLFSAEPPRLFPMNPWMPAWHHFVWENQAPL